MKINVVLLKDFKSKDYWKFVFFLVMLIQLCLTLSIYNHNFFVLPELKLKDRLSHFHRKPETSLINDDIPGCREFNLSAEHIRVSHLITRIPQVQCDPRTSQWKYAYETNLQVKTSTLIQDGFMFESCCFHTFHRVSKFDEKHEPHFVNKIVRVSNECTPVQDIGTLKSLDIETNSFGDSALGNNLIRKEFRYIVPWIAEPGEFLFINNSYSVKSKLFQRNEKIDCKFDAFYEFYCFCL